VSSEEKVPETIEEFKYILYRKIKIYLSLVIMAGFLLFIPFFILAVTNTLAPVMSFCSFTAFSVASLMAIYVTVGMKIEYYRRRINSKEPSRMAGLIVLMILTSILIGVVIFGIIFVMGLSICC